MIKFVEDCNLIVNLYFYYNKKKVNSKKDTANSPEIYFVLNKLSNKENLTPQEMFIMADINGNGNLNQFEFRLFFRKLGFTFSDHRVKEIFTYSKAKGKLNLRDGELVINQNEFSIALEYLQNKSISIALETLGISDVKIRYYLKVKIFFFFF